MTLPVSLFVNPEPGSFEFNAIRKALRERPRVTKIGHVDRVDYYLVEKTTALGLRRIVQVWEDPDKEIIEDQWGRRHIRKRGESWIECSCPAGTPREDSAYGNIMWLPKPCYHAAAVLITMSVNEANA